MKLEKSKKVVIGVLIILSVISLIIVKNDYFIYKQNILHITSVEKTTSKSDTSFENYYNQIITGVMKNGKYKNNKYTFENTASESGVYDDYYRKGADLFVEVSKDGNHIVGILGVKRDKYVCSLLIIFVDLLIIMAGIKGLFILVSLFINVCLSLLAVSIYKTDNIEIGILPLFMVVSIFFIVFSLFITNGKSKKTLSAILSSIISLFISFFLCYFMIKIFGENLPYWSMDYIETVYEYENFFLVSVLLSGLGAIMDISITISSSINELVDKNPEISFNNLIKSGKEISKDISGTMCNIMLFTCFTAIIPMVVLATRNYMSLYNALKHYGELELVLVLTSCISIVLTIPISLYISAYLMSKKGGKK